MRLLAGTCPDRALTYAEHLAVHGEVPERGQAELLDLAGNGGLRGRGGAGFPLARKLRATAGARGRAVVVANGSEGEPASRKDRTLLAANPHLVLDGVQLAVAAVGAREAYLCVHAGGLRRDVEKALRQRRDPVRVRVVEVPDRYVSGEAGALVNHLGGGPALPTTRYAPLAEKGLKGRPTLVQNVETLASFAVLARLGAQRFRALGTVEEPGTVLLTVRGAVREPRVVEVPVGTTAGAALALAGGAAGTLQAVLVGGFYGAWLPAPGVLDVPLSHAGLSAAGGSLGAGLLVALPAEDCGLAATATIATYLAGESARQCGPCLNGLPLIAAAMTDLARGGTAAALTVTLERLERWCGLVAGRGACSHPDGAVNLVRSALRSFAADVDRHLRGGCGRSVGVDLALP
jgi:NADH:ubiquinone oxidoreductase subunit F (NADH-binding)